MLTHIGGVSLFEMNENDLVHKTSYKSNESSALAFVEMPQNIKLPVEHLTPWVQNMVPNSMVNVVVCCETSDIPMSIWCLSRPLWRACSYSNQMLQEVFPWSRDGLCPWKYETEGDQLLLDKIFPWQRNGFSPGNKNQQELFEHCLYRCLHVATKNQIMQVSSIMRMALMTLQTIDYQNTKMLWQKEPWPPPSLFLVYPFWIILEVTVLSCHLDSCRPEKNVQKLLVIIKSNMSLAIDLSILSWSQTTVHELIVTRSTCYREIVQSFHNVINQYLNLTIVSRPWDPGIFNSIVMNYAKEFVGVTSFISQWVVKKNWAVYKVALLAKRQWNFRTREFCSFMAICQGSSAAAIGTYVVAGASAEVLLLIGSFRDNDKIMLLLEDLLDARAAKIFILPWPPPPSSLEMLYIEI